MMKITKKIVRAICTRNMPITKMPDENKEQLIPAPDNRERRALKIAARDAETRRAHYKKVGKKIAYWIISLAIVLGGGWLFISSLIPKGPDYSQAIPVLGRNHIADGTHTTYNSNPPTSGDHYAIPALVRFYENELPDEQVVHNLEHGQVWVTYKPGLPEKAIKTLRKLSGGNVIVTLRLKNDTDIATAAWGRLDKFNLDNGTLNEQRIKDFIIRYQNQGPENPSGFRGHLQ